MKPHKNKKVLIALDYNPTAQKVAETGYALAKAMDSEITLLHVVSDQLCYSSASHLTIMGFAGYVNSTKLLLKTESELKAVAQTFLDKSKLHLGDKTIETLVGEGDIAESILDVAKELKVDVIVMGSHSQKWLENIVMGSITEKVLRHSTISVFIIPTKKHN